MSNKKIYKIDFSKVETLEDIKLILESLSIEITVYDNIWHENFKKLDDKNLLVEV